jgi:predicted nucleic acid-binding Zn ribbon protein
MAHARRIPQLETDGRCHYCDEDVAHGALFCNTDCRDDYQKEQEAKRSAGR